MYRNKRLHDGAHLTLDDRKIIQAGIENNSTKKAIAQTIGKDATTVAKEIRRHRILKPRNTFNRPVMCAKKPGCPTKRCVKKCANFEEPKCNRRDKSPGACNKCHHSLKCYKDKYLYDAQLADEEYRRALVECREGLNLDDAEREQIGRTIAPLLANGQSVHQISSAHPELGVSERSLYNYIENGVFKEYGVDNFSLKEQVNRKLPKKYKKRREPVNFKWHTYADYLKFRSENPEVPTVEMDTLYNHPSGPYLQTFIFEKVPFMIGFLQADKTSASMARSLDVLCKQLGEWLFYRLFPLLLTDRGSEFEKHKLFERDADGNSRCNIFYCDPMQSAQKPHVENNHNYVRDIIPNGYPLENLTQQDIELMFSHINSVPRRILGDKTPYEVFCFLYGKEAASFMGITEIPRDEVVLKPHLVFAKKRAQ